MVGLAHQVFSATLSFLVPFILYTFVHPSIYIKSSEGSTKNILLTSLFWGLVFSSTLGLLLIIIYNCTLINEVSKNPHWWLFLPVPVPLALFLILDIFGIICCISAFRQSLYKCFIVAVMIITMFVRMILYHSGWIILLLITYPLQVGTITLIFITYYIAISFSFATVAVQWLKRVRNLKMSITILYIGTYAFFTFTIFITIYYFFLGKYLHEDSIAKFIPSLLPFLFIGFCSWIAQNIIFKMINYDEESHVSHSNENPENSNTENPHENEIVIPIEDNDNQSPQNSNNEDQHESEIVNPIEDNNNQSPQEQ